MIGDKGMLSFSVYNYDPILLVTSEGNTSITVPNPSYVQLPIIKSVIEDLQGFNVCECTSVSATPVNWVLDRVLGKFSDEKGTGVRIDVAGLHVVYCPDGCNTS